MTAAQRQRMEQLCNQLSSAEASNNLRTCDNMERWLRRDHYAFYLEVKDHIREVWDEFKKVAVSILEGAAMVAIAPVAIGAGVICGIFESIFGD